MVIYDGYIIVIIMVISLLLSWLYHCYYHGYITVIIMVISLLLSWLYHCYYHGYIFVIIMVIKVVYIADACMVITTSITVVLSWLLS